MHNLFAVPPSAKEVVKLTDASSSASSCRKKRRRGTSRCNENAIEKLAELLVAGRKAVVITGAGLSCASGIPPFRSNSAGKNKNAIWEKHVQQMGTRASFSKNPCRWYNDFWLPNFAPTRLAVTPNEGHEALARLCSTIDNLRVVTQNIDALHQSTSTSWHSHDRLIEAHGRVGLYKCASDPEDGCPYSEHDSIGPGSFSTALQKQLGHNVGKNKLPKLRQVPLCPSCSNPCMPQALLFDEDYTDHEFYQFDRLQEWLEEAEVVVFVGTSFAVTLTTLAMDEARDRHLPIFNFNIDGEDRSKPTLDWSNIEGPAEVRLPELVALTEKIASKARKDENQANNQTAEKRAFCNLNDRSPSKKSVKNE